MKVKKRIYFFIGLLSVLLYVLGVITGTKIQHFFYSITLSEIEILKKNLNELQNDLNSWKTQQVFLSNLQQDKKCEFLNLLLNNSQDKLTYYWSILPQRLEEFELKGVKTQEYENLKTAYIRVSLDVWGLSLQIEKECNSDLVPILYFYSPDNENIEQGKELDKLKILAEIRNKTIAVFTVDFNSDEQFLSMIKSTFKIERAPSLLIKNKVFTGLTKSEDLVKLVL